MLVSDFTGHLDIRQNVDGGALHIRAADTRVAISHVLLNTFHDNPPHTTWDGQHLTITGVGPDGNPKQVVYRLAGFDPTAHPEANEGGFHLFERVDNRQEAQ